MASFGMVVNNDVARDRILSIREKLQSDDLIKNPFVAKILFIKKDYCLVTITPVYPKIYLFSFLPFMLYILFNETIIGTIGLIISIIMLLVGIWWTPIFYYTLFYFATKKGVTYESASKAIEQVVMWDNKKYMRS